MTVTIGRRKLLAALGGAAAAWPLAARAQRPTMPAIGFLHGGFSESNEHRIAAFRKGLNETGYIDGENVAIEFRWAHDQTGRLPELAGDLVRRQVAVIVTPGSTTSTHAAKAATSTIPIVFGIGGDPVNEGLVQSLARPGGNITGVAFMTEELGAKRLGLLHELLPSATRVAHLVNPNNPLTAPLVADVQTAASSIGMQIEVITATNKSEIDLAFANMAQKRADALLIAGDALLYGRRLQIAILAARHAVATVFANRDFPEAGGHELRTQYDGHDPPGWHLCGSHSQGREGGRLADNTGDQIRTRHQSANRQNYRRRNSSDPARPRRRGDRVM